MPTALALSSGGVDAPALAADLAEVGVTVVAEMVCTTLVQDAIRHAPDLVIIYEPTPEPTLFGDIAAMRDAAPRPVVMFTTDPDADKIQRATEAGVHAYVINGYGQNRLRSVIHLAQARFRHEQVLRSELVDINRRFAERKLLDRAKGILMGARGLREEEAYQALRRTAMHTKRRMGQVAQQVIDTARYAEAINRAGQLRMLSQRLVKLYALICGGIRSQESRGLFEDSIGQIDSNLAILANTLSTATFGDLLDSVTRPWVAFRTLLAQPALTGRLVEADRLAEAFLHRSEQLTTNLEVAAFAAALHVVNLAGRQRMLCQRLAKSVLMAALLTGKPAERAGRAGDAAARELIAGFDYLRSLPLSNADIDIELRHAGEVWAALLDGMTASTTPAGQDSIAVLSERLLAHFERLTGQFERGVQALTG